MSAERAQGKLVGQHNARIAELEHLQRSGCIEVDFISVALQVRVQVWTTWDRWPIVQARGRELLIEAPMDGDWPTEQQMAQVALGLHVHGREIPPKPEPSQERAAMQAYRKQHVINWSKI